METFKEHCSECMANDNDEFCDYRIDKCVQAHIKELETRVNQLEKTTEIDGIQLASFANDWDKIIEILNDDNKGPTCKLQKIREVVE